MHAWTQTQMLQIVAGDRLEITYLHQATTVLRASNVNGVLTF